MARKQKAEPVAERTEICKNCKAIDFGADITCRLTQPQVLTDSNGVVTGSAWPIVPADGWCKAFEPKLND